MRDARPASDRSHASPADAAGALPERRVGAVTGGLGGIGAGTAVALTRRGFDVVVCDRAIDPIRAGDLQAQAMPGARMAFVAGDVADLADHGRFVDAVFGAFGRLDCLANNAGVSARSRGDLLDVSVESYDLNFAVNPRRILIPAALMNDRFLEREPMCSAQRPSPLGPINSQGAWY